jgi:uncharacterized repeat protein (TIGR01451 family)
LALTGGALLAGAPSATGFQIPTTPNGTWTREVNNSAKKVTHSATKGAPSGLRISVDTPPGAGIQVSERGNTTLLTQDATHLPVLPSAANGIEMQSPFGPCQELFEDQLSCNPGTLGGFTVTFGDAAGAPVPVRNPTLHLSRLGSTIPGTATPAALSLQLTTAGVNLAALPGATNLNIVSDVQIDGAVGAAGFGATCPNSGCGSVAVVGTTSRLVFAVGALRESLTPSWAGNDGFYLTASVDEDFGDAPASYDGATPASHVVTDLVLGAGSTADTTPSANGGATGAPLIGTSPLASPGADADTDDALPAIPLLSQDLAGRPVTVSVPYSGASRDARLCAWIDFDRNGEFSTAERACTAAASGSGTAVLRFTAPATIAAGQAVARFRVGYSPAQVEVPTGLADSGEVEDVATTIAPAGAPPVIRLEGTNRVRLAVDADESRQASPGDTLEYTMTVSNTGNTPATDVRLTAAVDRNAILLADVSTSDGIVTEGAPAGRRIAVAVPRLDPGRSATVVLRTRIRRPLPAGVTRIVSQGVVSAPGLPAVVTDDPATPAAVDATVVRIIDRTTLGIVVRGPTAVRAGRSATYRVRVTNTGRFTATGVRVVVALPSGLRPQVGRQGGNEGGRITRVIPTIDPSRTVVVRIPVKVSASRRAVVIPVVVTSSNAPGIRSPARRQR